MKPVRLVTLLLLAAGPLVAQTPAPTAAPVPATEDDVVVLSPFTVSADSFNGYYASQTLAGTRLKTNIDEVASSIQVITPEFMTDVGASGLNDLFLYTTSTESSGINGNFSDWSSGETATNDGASRRMPQTSQRVRGLAGADLTRNYFLTLIPTDRFNTELTEINRGANAILFGLGSPAGIANSGLTMAGFKNSAEISIAFDSESSKRTEIDLNQVLIDDRLSVRVAGLYDDTQFYQRPAYELDRRLYGAFTAKPWKSAILRGFIEEGSRDANRPNTLPPSSTISSWFANSPILVQKMRAALTAAGSTLTVPDDMKVTYSPIAWSWRSGNNYLTDPRIPDAMKLGILRDSIIYHDNNEANPRMVFHPNMSRQIAAVFQPDWRDPSTGLVTTATAIESNISQISSPPLVLNPDGVGTAPAYNYFASEQPWRTSPVLIPISLTNLDMFDFTREMLSGDAAFQNDDWRQTNVSFEQTGLDERVGVEIAYDRQVYDRESFVPFQGYTGIFVDALEEYMGLPNPNLGRPYIMERTSLTDMSDERETMRATAFGVVEPATWAPDSAFARFLGKHTFTGFFSQYDQSQTGRSWGQYFQDPTGGFVFGTADALGSNRRKVNNIVYLGDSLMDATSEQDVHLVAMDNQKLWDPGRLHRIYTYNTTARAFQIQELKTDAELEDLTRDTQNIDTMALTWNASLLNNHIIGLIGWREDSVVSEKRQALTGVDALADAASIDDPASILSRIDDSFRTTSWSVVGRWPQPWLKLPFGADLNAYYGESENFSLGATANDFYGNTLPSPSGTTREYGVVLKLFDAKVVARLNRYETDLANNPTSSVYSKFINQGILKPYASLLEAEFHGNHPPTTNDPGTPNYAVAMDALADLRVLIPDSLKALANVTSLPSTGVSNRSDVANLGDTEDVNGTGTELEVIVNATEAWRLSLNVANQETVITNYSPRMGELWTLMEPILGATGTIGPLNYFNNPDGIPPSYISGPTPTSTSGTGVYQWLELNVLSSYRNAKLQEGRVSDEQRAWRANLVTNYDFRGEFLRGFSVGTAVRWQDGAVIGYPTELVGDTLVSDIDNPHVAPSITNVDLWLRYGRKFGKMRWQIELRVQNINHSAEDLIPVRSENTIDYRVAQYRIGPPRVWSVVNTFKF
jgi:hypothetical protein